MYSVVLMMALSGSPAEVPAFGNRGCRGCSGCSGCAGCYGCGGGCHGERRRLFGNRGCRGCHGCHGCSGYSCHGCSGYACHGCQGAACHGCHGGAACHGCQGGAAAMPAAKPPMKKPEPVKKPPEEKESMVPAPATIVVSLPAEAKLIVDNVVTKSTSATRTFISPELEQGKDFYYTLKAEIVRDGTPVSVSQRVTVRAGEETRVSFELPVATVAAK